MEHCMYEQMTIQMTLDMNQAVETWNAFHDTAAQHRNETWYFNARPARDFDDLKAILDCFDTLNPMGTKEFANKSKMHFVVYVDEQDPAIVKLDGIKATKGCPVPLRQFYRQGTPADIVEFLNN
jgi:hypothetical protein